VPLGQLSITVTGALPQAEYRLYAMPSPPATGFSPITATEWSSPSGQSRLLKTPKLGHGAPPAGIVVDIVWDELIVELGAADEVVNGVDEVVSTRELLVEVLVE
jgi:hypothetical protein